MSSRFVTVTAIGGSTVPSAASTSDCAAASGAPGARRTTRSFTRPGWPATRWAVANEVKPTA